MLLAAAVAISLLFPPATLGYEMTPSGLLKGIYNEQSVEVNNIVRIHAEFENKGEAATSAAFLGEIYLDGKLVTPIRSNELYVYPREVVNITCYFKPDRVGNYEIRGFVLYSKTTTAAKKSLIQVLPRRDEGPDMTVVQLGAGGMVIALVSFCILVIFLVRRKEEAAS